MLGKTLAFIAALSPTAAFARCGCDVHHDTWRHARWHHVEHTTWHSEHLAAVTDRVCNNYPRSAFRDQASGVTWLKVGVDDNGWVQASRISHSSGRNDLDRAALACVTDWHFRDADRYDWRVVRVGWRFHWHGWS